MYLETDGVYSFFCTKCRYIYRGMKKKFKKRRTPAPEASISMLVTQMMDTTRSFATKSCEVRV